MHDTIHDKINIYNYIQEIRNDITINPMIKLYSNSTLAQDTFDHDVIRT